MAAIEQLIERGELERVPADTSNASDWIGDAARHLEAAAAIASIDQSGAFTLAYDAARKSCAALLLSNGLRARAVPGSHRAVIEAARLLVRSEEERTHIARLDRMRRDRNRSEYGSRSFGESEVETAIRYASEIVRVVRSATGL